MLNRRILRVKAIQALYGYFISMESLKESSRINLKKNHAFNPARHDFSNKALFEERIKLMLRLFNENVLNTHVETAEEIAADILDSVNAELQDLHKKLGKETHLKKADMLKDTNKIYEQYLKLLSLPIELEHREKLDKEKRENHESVRDKRAYPFISDPIVEKLKNSEIFQKELNTNQINWGDEQDEIKNWHRKEIINAKFIENYFDLTKKDTFNQDELVLELFKKVIFKNETINSYFEDQDLHWTENQPIIKSMVLKTVKSMVEGEGFKIGDLTKNGEEDFDFLEGLYSGAISENNFLDALIASKAKNWEVERIAITDRIILKVALVEMITYPSIPLKVSINEAIEISKVYSTPKSKQFVNGVLDVLSNELSSKGKIRKSGRGLIDNK